VSFYIIEWNVGPSRVDTCVATTLKDARRVARVETGWDETVRISRVTGLQPVPISPRKENTSSDVSPHSS
jgi:hypothetical protein